MIRVPSPGPGKPSCWEARAGLRLLSTARLKEGDMALLVGSLTIGVILSLLAMGILISFRVVAFEDLTVDGSVTLGGAVAAALIVSGLDPLWATGAAGLAGATAGTATAITHTKFRINPLLSGILVMTALYSVNLRIMGKST